MLPHTIEVDFGDFSVDRRVSGGDVQIQEVYFWNCEVIMRCFVVILRFLLSNCVFVCLCFVFFEVFDVDENEN